MGIENIGAVIMIGAGGNTPQEQFVAAAQRASTIDLVNVLREQGISKIVIAAPTTEWIPTGLEVISDADPTDQPFHFGQRLSGLIEKYEIEPVLYFGGGSAPLIDSSVCGMLIGLLLRSAHQGSSSVPTHIALTNNLHSADWIAISHVQEALPILRECDRDNSTAWLLKESGHYDVRVLSGVRPATSIDIDTPSDLALLASHPNLHPELRNIVADTLLAPIPIDRVLDVLRVEAKTVMLIGRVSPLAWNALNKATRCWTRVVAEERGMVASGRIERNEVKSVLLSWVKARGFSGFFMDLAEMTDAVLFDDRVLFAAFGKHPSTADRFASDLFWTDVIQDSWLREFTYAAKSARIPVILGGHSLVAGGLYVLAEIMEQQAMGASKPD
ncbi:MAG: hypothetical protein KF716_08520 [Anaerolineae bacterium]|nr:hypothetical protein [Anaerolineae bacterium]